MGNDKDMDFKVYEELVTTLKGKQAMKTKLAVIKAQAANIFDTDDDGNIAVVNRGKFKNVPLIKKLWAIAHIRKVLAFLAALLDFIESLKLDEVDAKAVAAKPSKIAAPKVGVVPTAVKK